MTENKSNIVMLLTLPVIALYLVIGLPTLRDSESLQYNTGRKPNEPAPPEDVFAKYVGNIRSTGQCRRKFQERLYKQASDVWLPGQQQQQQQQQHEAVKEVNPGTEVWLDGVESSGVLSKIFASELKITVETFTSQKSTPTPFSSITYVKNLRNMVIDYGGLEFKASALRTSYLLRVVGSHGIVIRNLNLKFLDEPKMHLSSHERIIRQSGVLIDKSTKITFENCAITGSPRASFVIKDSSHITITNSVISNYGAAGIVVQGNSSFVDITDNIIEEGIGVADYHAGVVVTNRLINVKYDLMDLLDQEIPTPMPDYSLHSITISKNEISLSRSAGIFAENVMNALISENKITSCSKEGITLTGISVSCVITDNIISRCGNRWSQTPDMLKSSGLPDTRVDKNGFSVFKLPGISISSGLHNIVAANLVKLNYGGGIKFVRRSHHNYVVGNELIDNNEGATVDVFHFPGMFLMSDGRGTAAENGCTGNVLVHNLVRGTHGVGVLIANGSGCNTFFSNHIEFLYFGFEAISDEVVNFEALTVYRRLQGSGPDVLRATLQTVAGNNTNV
eukprot:TRINITY_DN9752_c0_g5_i1.p1 TRINITY_DN9752_c0_g5~~TRINITY_DN9752_c0_g5_i1.p1  ORF type:complete len:564 (+),score=45.81 TRINITY_DN9752_c0_g5_i1:45-1736(+)